jgi:hypothetical protein
MHTAIEIAERVAAGCVRVEEQEHHNGQFSAVLTAPGGQAVYSMLFGWKGGAEDHARRVRGVVSTIIAKALAEDREQRCSGCEAEKRALVAALEKARGVIQSDRSLLIHCETVGASGDVSTMDTGSRLELAALDALLGEIERVIGKQGSTAEPLRVSTVAPDPLPSSAGSAASAVKDSSGGGACS